MRVTLVPVVARPWLVGHVLDCERFVRRQFDVLERAPAALVDRGLEDGGELVDRDDKLFAVGIYAFRQ